MNARWLSNFQTDRIFKCMIRTKQERREIVIDLTGPDGNAFVLMGMAKNFARQLGKDGKAITEEMMAGDYEHLLSVFDRATSSWVAVKPFESVTTST